MNALDPVKRIERQIGEAIRLHEPERRPPSARVGELLERVGIPARAAPASTRTSSRAACASA